MLSRAIEVAASLVVSLALSLAPTAAYATAPPTDGPTPAELFREGQARADAADYAGAIERYEAAIARLPDDSANDGTRNRLRVELVRAHRKAFEIDDDPTHLTKAKVLLDDYAGTLDSSQAQSREWVDAELLQIDDALTDHASRHAPEPDDEPDPELSPATGPRLEITPAAGEAKVDHRPDPHAGRSLLVAGGVLAGLGVGSVIMMAAGLGKAKKAVGTFETDPGRRDTARADNQLGNTLGIAGGVAAGVFLTAGAVLLVLGAQKKQRERRTAVAPVIDRDQVGLVLRARF